MSTSADLPNSGAIDSLAENRPATRALTPTGAGGAPSVPAKRTLRTRPEILTSRATPGALLNAFRRRFWLATILATMFGAAVAAALYFLVPAKYVAAARVQVYSDPSWIMNPLTTGRQDPEGVRRTTQQQMKLELVLRDALEDAKVSRSKTLAGQIDPIVWLEKNLEVEFMAQSEFLRIGLKGDNKEDLPNIINAVVSSYFKLIVDTAKLQLNQRREKIQNSYDTNRTRLEDFARQILTESEKAGVINSENARLRLRIETEKLERIAADIERDRQELRHMELEVSVLENRTKDNAQIPDELVDMEVERSAAIQEVQKKLELLDAEIAKAESIFRNKNAPQITRLYQQKATLQANVQEMKKKIKDEIKRRIALGQPATPMTAGRSLLDMQNQSVILRKRMEGAQKDFDSQRVVVEKMGNSTAMIEGLVQQRDVLRKIVDEQYAMLEKFKIEADAPPPAKWVEQAKEPKDRDSMIFKLGVVAFGGAVSFGLVALGISFLEFQSRRMNTATEVTDELGLRHVGDLPEFSGLQLGRLLTFQARSSAKLQDLMSESVDSIRLGLVHQATKLGKTPVVLITSANDREGKSTLATRLAVSLANSGKRTLLIDGNLRNPQVHQAFHVAGEPGLCDLLRDPSMTLSQVANDVDIPGLSVVAAGVCDDSAFHGMARGTLDTILEAARIEFGFVVVDGAPTLPVADGLTIAAKSDFAIVSTRRDVTKIPEVYESCERLKGVGATVLGVVVNGTI